MPKIIKIILVIFAVFVLAGVVIGGYFYYTSQQPLYEPGDLRASDLSLRPPKQGDDPNFWQVEEDIQLFHFARGQGRNVLVLHGGPGFPFTDPMPGFEPLVEEYHFHYYDQRGSGRSTRPIDTFDSNNYFENITSLDETLGIGAQLADIERIRQILGEEKIILVGHSFGGFLASLYAAEYPEKVEALVLIAPANVLVMPQEEDDLFLLIKERLSPAEQIEYEAFMEEYLNFGDIFSRSEAELSAMNRKFAEYYESVVGTEMPIQVEPGGWMVQGMYISMGARHDYRESLPTVTAPVLVIHGAQDLQSEAATMIYVDAFPNSRLAIMQTGHFPFVEMPEEFANVVGDFFAELK